MNTVIKTDLVEEINGLLILLGTKDAMRELVVKSLHLMSSSTLKEYRDSLVKDHNIGVTKPRDLDLENEI
jgi:hypothetical protein